MRSAIFCSMLCVSCICYFLTGCGGGGGGSDVEDFSGVWSGNAALVDDTCGAISTDQQFIFFTHLVNQNEAVIALDNGFLAFTGAVQSEASFTASTTRDRPPVLGADSCSETITFRYEAISNNQAQFVVRNSDVTCKTGSQTSQCKFAFSGNAFRTSAPSPEPRPLPLEGDIAVGAPVGDNRGVATGIDLPAVGVDAGATDEATL